MKTQELKKSPLINRISDRKESEKINNGNFNLDYYTKEDILKVKKQVAEKSGFGNLKIGVTELGAVYSSEDGTMLLGRIDRDLIFYSKKDYQPFSMFTDI